METKRKEESNHRPTERVSHLARGKKDIDPEPPTTPVIVAYRGREKDISMG